MAVARVETGLLVQCIYREGHRLLRMVCQEVEEEIQVHCRGVVADLVAAAVRRDCCCRTGCCCRHDLEGWNCRRRRT